MFWIFIHQCETKTETKTNQLNPFINYPRNAKFNVQEYQWVVYVASNLDYFSVTITTMEGIVIVDMNEKTSIFSSNISVPHIVNISPHTSQGPFLDFFPKKTTDAYMFCVETLISTFREETLYWRTSKANLTYDHNQNNCFILDPGQKTDLSIFGALEVCCDFPFIWSSDFPGEISYMGIFTASSIESQFYQSQHMAFLLRLYTDESILKSGITVSSKKVKEDSSNQYAEYRCLEKMTESQPFCRTDQKINPLHGIQTSSHQSRTTLMLSFLLFC